MNQSQSHSPAEELVLDLCLRRFGSDRIYPDGNIYGKTLAIIGLANLVLFVILVFDHYKASH